MRPVYADYGVCRACFMKDACKDIVCRDVKMAVYGISSKNLDDCSGEELEFIEKKKKEIEARGLVETEEKV